MTPYVTRLLNAIRNTPLNQYDVDNFNELVAYITELERKAAYHDRLMAMQTEEQTSEREPERNE